MQSPIIHQQLILSTERIRDLHRSMQAHSSAIPAAEMDVFLAEIRKLYELALQLNYQNAMQLLNEMQMPNIAEMRLNNISTPSTPPIPSPSNTIVEASTPPPADEPVKTEQPLHTGSVIKDNDPVIASASDTIRKEEMSEAPVEIPGKSHAGISMDKLMADISKAETAAEVNHLKKPYSDLHEMFDPSPTIAHNFEEHETLGDRIAQTRPSHSVSEQLHKIPVKDIKAAIGLNEKFQFINQLFNGDSQKYNASVDHLNSCGSSDRAQEFLKNISQEHNWEKQSSVASLFMEIVERRFLG